MCMSTPSAPPPVPTPPPAPQASGSATVAAAGASQRARVAAMAGPMQMIQNAGGAAGLTAPASTTAKMVTGA